MDDSSADTGWTTTTVGDVVSFYTAGDAFQKLEYSQGGIPVLAKGDVKSFGRLEFGGGRFISVEMATSRGYRKTRAGDLILTTRDLTQAADFLGLVAPIADGAEYLVNQGANIIRLNDKVDPRFFVYWCNGPTYRAHIKGNAVGSTQIHLRKADFLNAPILLPPLSEQRAIGNVLGALDDKMELFRHMNQTLEEIARAIFHSWFIDFDPVHARIEGRRPVGMDTKTAELFSDTFDNSEIGPIPAGWRVGSIHDYAELSRESLNPALFPKELFEHYSLPAFDDGQRPVIQFGAEIKSNKLNVPPQSVLVSKLNPHIPRVWLPDVHGPLRAICSTEYLVLTPLETSWRAFLYALVSSPTFLSALASRVTGTTGSHQRVSPESLLSIPAAIPPKRLIQAFDAMVTPMFLRVAANRRETTTLEEIRDALLPSLLNGELRVRNLD